MPDSILGKAALGASVLTLAGIVQGEQTQLADAQNLGETPAALKVPMAEAAADGLDDADVNLCQDMVIGAGSRLSKEFLKSDEFSYKVGAKTVSAELTLGKPKLMSGNTLRALCSQVTKNSVSLQVVSKERIKGKKASKVKIWGRAATVSPAASAGLSKGSDTTIAKKNLTLPRKLTQKDVSSHRYGVRETVTSQPLLQVPHIDDTNSSGNIMGPMQTRKAVRTVWLTQSQLKNLGRQPGAGNGSVPSVPTSKPYSIDSPTYTRRTNRDNKECHGSSLAATYTIRQDHVGKMKLTLDQVQEADGKHGRWTLTGFKHICDVIISSQVGGESRLRFTKMINGVYEDPLSVDKLNDQNAKNFVNQLTVYAE
jgi:hypothetical protein